MSDVLIVGSGPAGLGAAERLAAAGLAVTVAERQPHPGGMPPTCGHSPFGWREFRRILSGRAYADRLVQAAERAGARLRLGVSVTGIDAQGRVTLVSDAGVETLHPARILLATGAREASRAERLLPGERPLGVLTTGALQDLWFRRRARPFRAPVILGSELVAMSAILTCRAAGAAPLALLEPLADLTARAPFRWLPKALGLPVHRGAVVTDLIARDGRLAALRYRSGLAEREIACDGLVLTGAFRPEAGMARMAGLAIDPGTLGPAVDGWGRTSNPAVFAAGNVLRGVETAGWCWDEGRRVAGAILADLQSGLAAPSARLVAGPGMAWVMPQQPDPQGALPVQAHVARPSSRLILRDWAGRAVWTQQMDARPERRILIPAKALLRAEGARVLTVEAE